MYCTLIVHAGVGMLSRADPADPADQIWSLLPRGPDHAARANRRRTDICLDNEAGDKELRSQGVLAKPCSSGKSPNAFHPQPELPALDRVCLTAVSFVGRIVVILICMHWKGEPSSAGAPPAHR